MKKLLTILGALVLGANLIISCSKNFYSASLVEKYEKSNTFQKLNSLGKQALIKTKKDDTINCLITGDNGVTLYFVEINDTIVTNNKGYVLWRNIVEINYIDEGIDNNTSKNIDIYYNIKNVKKDFEVKSYYHWKFISLPLFYNVILKRKSIQKHVENCLKIGADGVIIEPNLIHSTTITYQ